MGVLRQRRADARVVNTPARDPNRFGVGAALSVLAFVGVWWVAAQCGSLLAHQRLAPASLADAAVALGRLHAHLGDPAAAWPTRARDGLAGPVVYWVSTMLTVACAGTAGFAVWSRVSDRRRAIGSDQGGGFARRSELRTLTVTAPTGGRVTLGRIRGRLVAAEPQTSLAVVGPTGCGKTAGFAIPALREWDGPIIATSVKTDLLDAGLDARRNRGKVWIFDPTGAADEATAGWSPLAACGTWGGAMRVAAWLCDAAQPRRDSVTDADYWYSQARKALAPHLYAAALAGRSMRDVVAWIDRQSHDEITKILSEDPAFPAPPKDTSEAEDASAREAADRARIRAERIAELRAIALEATETEDKWPLGSEAAWSRDQLILLDAHVDAAVADELDQRGHPPTASPALTAVQALWRKEARLQGSVYATIENVVAGYADPNVAAATDVGVLSEDDRIDVDAWLTGNDTIFVIAPAHEQARLRPVLTVLIQHAIRTAYEHANTTGGTLQHPCLVLLDEAGNIAPVRDLPTYASTARSHGISLVTIWQDLAQLRALYGDQARTVLNNHQGKLFGAGIADDQTLEYLSRLVGDTRRTDVNLSGDLHGPRRTINEHATYRRAAPVEALRRLPRDEAILLYGNLAPARLALRPWYRTDHENLWRRVVSFRGSRRA